MYISSSSSNFSSEFLSTQSIAGLVKGTISRDYSDLNFILTNQEAFLLILIKSIFFNVMGCPNIFFSIDIELNSHLPESSF